MGAAQVQSQLRYLKTTTAAPRRRGRDRRRSDRAAGIAIAARTHGARARARPFACSCVAASFLVAGVRFALGTMRGTTRALRCRHRGGRCRLRRGGRASLAAHRCDSHCAPRHELHPSDQLALPAPAWLFCSALLLFRGCLFVHRGRRTLVRRARCVAVRCAAPRQPSSETVRRGASVSVYRSYGGIVPCARG